MEADQSTLAGERGADAEERAWLRELLEQLSAIDRPSASAGERRAAEWIHERFAELGAGSRIESERAHGTYWWPLGIGAGAALLANLAALRGHRAAAAGLGAAAAAALVDEFPPASAGCETGCPAATPTTSSARSGPRRPSALSSSSPTTTPPTPASSSTRRSRRCCFAASAFRSSASTPSPALMWPLLASPALALAAGLSGVRAAAKLGAALGAGYVAAMADIGARAVVPGANDNGDRGRPAPARSPAACSPSRPRRCG